MPHAALTPEPITAPARWGGRALVLAGFGSFLASAAAAQETGLPPAEVIVVRAERLAASPTVAGTIMLGPDQFSAAPQQRLDSILRASTGAGLFRRTGSGPANATIQGLSLRALAPNGAGRAEVRIDGVPQNDPFGGWVAWGRFDPLFLDAVRLERGAAGAAGGPLALTGLVDLVEVRGGRRALRASNGSAGARSLAGVWSLEPAEADGTLVLMGLHDRADGTVPVAPRFAGPVDRPAGFELSGLTAAARIGTAPDDGAGLMGGRLSVFSERKGAGLVGGGSATRGADASLAWRRAGPGLDGRVVLYGQQRRFSNRTVTASPDRTSTSTANDQFDTPASAFGATAQLRLTGLPGRPVLEADWRRASGQTRERFRFLTGAPTRQRLAGGRQDWAGLAVRLEPSGLGGGLAVSGAVRVDHWRHSEAVRLETDLATGTTVLAERPLDRDGFEPSGRLSLHAPQAGLSLHLARTVRLPSLNELHRPFRIGNDLTEANAALAPERLDGLDLVYEHQAGPLRVMATAWVARLDGPVTNVTLGTGPGVFPRAGFLPAGGAYRERRNAGRIDASGLELIARWSGQQLTASGNASFTDAVVRDTPSVGLRPPQSPAWSAGADLSWRPRPDGPWAAGLAIRAEAERLEDDLGSRRLDGFAALDVRLSRQIGRATLAFVGENVTDSEIPTALAGDGVISLTGTRSWRIDLTWRLE